MIKVHSIKTWIGCFFLGALLLVSFARTTALADQYGYEIKDSEEQKARYMARLVEDKKKVDLAIGNTKTLIDKARNKPYLPELYLRLAELYVEESRLAYYLRKSVRDGESSPFDQLESNTLKNQALEIYQRILDNYPDFEARDKIHFFMAHEYRELGQIDDMVMQYRAIIKKYKKSKYVPESYLLLGDYFINLQDLDTAKKHYEAVLDFPESPAISIARYKLAWCNINKADFKAAIKLFEKAVSIDDQEREVDIDTYKRVDIKLEALMDMAYCYTECYKKESPEEALAYFRKYAWSRHVYTAVLEKLAYRFFIKRRWHHAAEVYRQLSGLQHDPEKLLEYSRNIFECVQSLGTFENADQDMALIIKALKKEKYSIHINREQKQKDLTDFELYTRNIVTHLHNQARKKKSIDDFRCSADAYGIYLEFFKDSPVRAEMAANYAEALFSSRQYLEAGKQYEKLSKDLTSKDIDSQKCLYSAVISYYTALKGKEDLNYYEVAYSRDGLKTTGRLFAKTYPDSEKVADVEFNVAWITYDEGDYEEAIREFTSFVGSYPNGTPAYAAVNLILDAYNLKEDYEGLIEFGKGILGNAAIKDKKLRKEVATIVKATESKVISSLTVAALDDWEKGKSDLLEFASRSKSTGMGEQALNAVIVSSKEKGDIKTLLTTGSDLIREYPKSPKVETTLGMMIDTSIKVSQFRFVADYLEAFASRLPKHVNVRDFLLQAGHIRRGLGQFDRSNRDYEKLLALDPKDNGKLEEIVFAMSNNTQETGDTDKAIDILEDCRGKLSRSGKVRADAMLSDLYRSKGKKRTSGKYRKRAKKAYKPSLAQKAPMLNFEMAKMVYNSMHDLNNRYMGIVLKDKIDNKVVAQKAKMLARLEKGYQSVIQYKSTDWVLKACYQSYLVNNEFARFLRQSPLPDELTPEQKQQYTAILNQKAQAYIDKAEQYYQTVVQQAHKWQVCDPRLASLIRPETDQSGRSASGFSHTGARSEITDQCLMDDSLRGLHQSLLKKAEDVNTLIMLAEAYMDRGDYCQATLIAQKALDVKKSPADSLKARIYNCIGVSRLYLGMDSQAKDAFKEALSLDENNIGARINLAGLLQHYGHSVQAKRLYEMITAATQIEAAKDIIHPRAKELYYATIQISKK